MDTFEVERGFRFKLFDQIEQYSTSFHPEIPYTSMDAG